MIFLEIFENNWSTKDYSTQVLTHIQYKTKVKVLHCQVCFATTSQGLTLGARVSYSVSFWVASNLLSNFVHITWKEKCYPVHLVDVVTCEVWEQKNQCRMMSQVFIAESPLFQPPVKARESQMGTLSDFGHFLVAPHFSSG